MSTGTGFDCLRRELLYMAIWQCLIHGRPPLLTQRHVDIQLPDEETEETMGTDPTC